MTTGQLTFFGGVGGKSGGVQVLYGKGNSALLFDFGIEHDSLLKPTQMTTYDPVYATPKREMRQYLLGGMTAPLFELYDPEQVRGVDPMVIQRIWSGKKFPHYERIAIFIGHMHQDHIAMLPYTHPNIPVYMNHDAHSLYRGIVAAGLYPDTAAKIHVCDDLSIVDFGDFTMQIVEMDHSATGTAGIIIESNDHKIAYTGDWRFHGKHPERIERFMTLCREKKIDVLLTEGTRLPANPADPPPHQPSEVNVLTKFSELLNHAIGLVYVQMSPRDLVRMADMMAIATEKGRKIVMDAAHAVVWHTATHEGLHILKDHPALHTTIQVMDASIIDGIQSPYETIAIEEVAEHKHEFLYFFKFPNLAHMVELETLGSLQNHSHFIHADYGVKLKHDHVAKYLETFHITGHAIGNGGHAHPEVIANMIEQIAPKVVIPVHTRHPRSLDTRGIKAFYPEKGDTISINDLIKATTNTFAEEESV